MNYRVEFCSEIVNALPDVRTLLDVGCRDCILSKYLSGNITYEGADLFQNADDSVDYVGDFTEISISSEYDVVVALDVVEHVDNASEFVRKLFERSNKYVVIGLPNSYSIIHWREFLARGNFGAKYAFDPFGSIDRHRWMVSVREAVSFYNELAQRFDASIQYRRLARFGGRFGWIVPSFRGLNVRGVIACFKVLQ